jgi:hypothetical protein
VGVCSEDAVVVDTEGSVVLVDAEGSVVLVDAEGSVVLVDAEGSVSVGLDGLVGVHDGVLAAAGVDG